MTARTPVTAECTQPRDASHASVVHGSPSSHATVAWRHRPLSQRSVVHAFPSVQSRSSAHPPAAENASRRPAPALSSAPGAPMSTAVARRRFWICAGVSAGFRASMSAAAAAEWGAAAEVPKNRHAGGQRGNPPAFEMLTPSKATMSGFGRVSGAGKKMRAGPCELYGSTVASAASETSIAPTATASRSAGCPTTLPDGVTYCCLTAPKQKSFKTRVAPAALMMASLNVCVAGAGFTIETSSMGSCVPVWGFPLSAMSRRVESKTRRS